MFFAEPEYIRIPNNKVIKGEWNEKRKAYIMIAASVLSLNLYGCGVVEELKEECVQF